MNSTGHGVDVSRSFLGGGGISYIVLELLEVFLILARTPRRPLAILLP